MIRFSQTKSPSPERHTAGALLAMALQQILPGSHVIRAGGTEIGFYCDCLPAQPLQDFVLRMIEERMVGLIKEDLPVKPREMIPSNASDYFSHHDHPWQAQIARRSAGLASIVDIGGTYYLGSQEQASSTGEIGAIKLIRFEPITASLPDKEVKGFRVIGIQEKDKSLLKKAVKRRNEADKSDHRRLGEQMELFVHKEDLGEGSWLFLPKGEALRRELICWEQEHLSQLGGQWVGTPQIQKGVIESEPAHQRLFGLKPRHYCELPLNFLEQRKVVISCADQEFCGLFRCQEQTVHVGSLFTLESQFDSLLQSIDRTLTILGIPFRWEQSDTLAQVVWLDRLGREWLGGFVSREEPDEALRVLGADGAYHVPEVITYSLFGSIERLMGLWLEQTGGVLPLWVAPEQIRLLPKESAHFDRCIELEKALAGAGFRCGIDWEGRPTRERLARAFEQRVPKVVLVGSGELTLRSIEGEASEGLSETEVVEQLRNEVNKTRGQR